MAIAQLRCDVAQVRQQRVCTGPDAGLWVATKTALVVGINGGLQLGYQMLGQGLKCFAVVVEAVHAEHDVLWLRARPDACGQGLSAWQLENGGGGWLGAVVDNFVGQYRGCGLRCGGRASGQERDGHNG